MAYDHHSDPRTIRLDRETVSRIVHAQLEEDYEFLLQGIARFKDRDDLQGAEKRDLEDRKAFLSAFETVARYYGADIA
jgi:hypothetical protein